MKKNHTIPVLILSVITTIATIGLLIFFLKIIENKNEHASVVLQTLQDKMQEKENTIANASKITEVKEIQNHISSYFVDPDKIDVFVNYLEDMGANFGSKISVESIEAPDKDKNIISMKLSLKGTFGEVMKTINYLENIPYQIEITQIYLNEDTKQIIEDGFKAVPKVKTTKIPTWQADISFNVLSLN